MPVRTKVTKKGSARRETNLLVNAFGDPARRGSVLFAARGACAAIAKEMAKEIRDKIYRQEFPHVASAPLSPTYVAWKDRMGLDPRVLIATGKYVRAIGYVETPYGGIVGLVRKTRKGKKPLPYALLQRWLEYGTRKMPARPHWRPMMTEWKSRRREFGLRIKSRVGKALKAALSRGRS